MKWKKFTLETTTDAVDYLGSMFDDIGIEGMEIEDNVPLTESETKGMFIDILPELPPDDGTARVSFYLDEDEDTEEKLKAVREGLEEIRQFVNIGTAKITESETDDKDWINNWKQYFKPFTVDHILIKPTWEEIPEEHKDKLLIQIDPGTAFGTGKHETTQLCIRQLEKYVKRETKKLEEKEEKATKNGENFTVMANNEFDALFNGDDRDNEVEFRLLFTPLAQKNMLDLLKSKVPYGDDFYFYKHKKLNYIISSHSQNFDYNPDMSIFHHFDVDEAKKNFVEFNDEYYQSLYFDLAPLLAIPSYQQIKTQEYIYNTPYRANITSYEHESLANRFDKDLLKHPESSTSLIIKTKFDAKNGKSDQVTIEARSFKAVKQTTVVSKLGGDGRMHAVPVVWYEYIPIVKNTLMEAKNTKLRKNEYLKEKNNSEFSQFMSQYSKNNAIIYERGLFSVLLDKELDENSSLKFNSLLARKGEKE